MTRDGLWLTGHASGCQWVGQALVRRCGTHNPRVGQALVRRCGTHSQRVGQALVRQYTQSEGGAGLGPAVHTVVGQDLVRL